MSWITAPLQRLAGWVTKSPGDDYWYTSRGSETGAGVQVNEDLAMTFATVFACVSKTAKTTATLPFHVYRHTGERERTKTTHWLSDLLGGMANQYATGMSVREALLANLMLWGNAYAKETWTNGRGRLLALEVLPSRHVTVRQDTETGEFIYEYRPQGASKPDVYTEDRILHVRGLSFDGKAGVSVIGMNRQAVGLGMAATTFGESFFGNGAWFGGLITKAPNNTKQLSQEAGQALLKELSDKFRGASKAFGFGMLRGELEFQQIDMPFEDAMFLQTREFQRTEICSIFDMPPAMIQDHSRSTFSNTEQQDIAFAKHTILPWCIRLEAALNGRYLRTGDGLYSKHNLAGLMRGDFQTRMTGYGLGRQWGFFSINDVREMEDLNPIGVGGDEYLVPLNMRPAGQPVSVDAPAQPNRQPTEEEESNARAA